MTRCPIVQDPEIFEKGEIAAQSTGLLAESDLVTEQQTLSMLAQETSGAQVSSQRLRQFVD